MDATYSDLLEIRQLAEERYPDLSPDDAFLQLYHDAFVKYPKEMAKKCGPAAISVLENVSDALEFVAIVSKNPQLLAAAPVARILKKFLSKKSESLVNSTTAAGGETLSQLGTETVQNLSSAMPGQSITDAPQNVIREIHGIHVIGNSLVDHIKYYGRWMQTVSAIQIAQGNQVIQALNVIGGHLHDTNAITVSGGGGPDGFARPVYDFVHKKINDLDQSERHRHRYFVYHPDTNWYGAFHRLIRENPLPAEFCAKSDNLDTICLFMQDVRQRLTEESSCGKDIIFHLLIPSWYSITIKQPLHFPDSLHPLSVEGEKHKGKELVEMNLPEAPMDMLEGINNVLDPNHSTMIATVTARVVGAGADLGMNGASLALGGAVSAFTGIGVLVIPIWIAGYFVYSPSVTFAVGNTIYNTLSEEAPRILGSTERLYVAPLIGDS